MPPPHQLYRGLPGIHVAVWNPEDERARSLGGGTGMPLQTTIVQTHTSDKPFIVDSLKNYFQNAGVRVYSTIHPMFTVRRQWERIVSLGGIRFRVVGVSLVTGELLGVSFTMGDQTIDAVGRVVRTHRLDENATEVALEFVRIDPWVARVMERAAEG